LNQAILINSNLRETVLTGIQAAESKLNGANLSESVLNGGLFSLADLGGTNLENARLRGAWFNLASLTSANLVGADLNGALLYGSDLSGADLRDAKLNGAVLIGANLSGADLRGADLTGATLTLPLPPNVGNDFSYQNLSGAELISAMNQSLLKSLFLDNRMNKLPETRIKPILKDTLLQGTKYDSATIWPAGFIIPDSAIKVE